MIANLICIFLISAYSLFVLYRIIANYRHAKKDNIPRGCFSCSAYKAGQCKSHKCNSGEEIRHDKK